MGGLGKTTLAQLVYNDARIISAFPMRIWTCVSDHDQGQLEAEQVLRKILGSYTGQNHDGFANESVQKQLRETLSNNRFLLVLDDVWTESRNHWLQLVEFLLGGQKGSWIVVTTRSHETARIVGNSSITHELQGLSMEESRCLFEKITFGSEHLNPHDDFVKISREIVEQCVGVPLAIRVVGSLLHGQGMSKWLLFEKIRLSNTVESQKNIMPILKLSYHQLESPLKSCFTYCALFSKDYEINKELLIRLWIAQAYITPFDDGQTVQDAAEEYFSILLRRCFFQDVKHDFYGNIVSCKIHDLTHDIAVKVGGKEICLRNFVSEDIDKKVRHIHQETILQNTLLQHFHSICYFGNAKAKMEQRLLEELYQTQMCLRVPGLERRVYKKFAGFNR